MSQETKHYGMLAEYESPAELMAAAAKVRDAGYRQWDVYSPFPVHGMDGAMGLRNSRVGWFTFLGGLFGFTSGMLMIWFMNSFDYSIVVGGKPFFSPVYAFPISYECTILLGAFGSLFGMLYLNKLPMLHHPLLKNESFKRATHDGFFIVIESSDPRYSERDARRLLKTAGGKHIELVEE